MLHISRWMKKEVISIPVNSSIRQAIQLFLDHHIGTLPVVDESHHLVGILRLQDVIDLGMPDFIHLVTDFDFLHGFGAVENQRPDPAIFEKDIKELMNEAVSVHEDAGLFRFVGVWIGKKSTNPQEPAYRLPVKPGANAAFR